MNKQNQLFLMRVRSYLLLSTLLLSHISGKAQIPDNNILLTVNGVKIQSGEFIRMYHKSIEPQIPQDINSYLDQFIIFKLKVADAVAEGMDTSKAFINELKGYRNQLAESYLTDNRKKEEIIKKAYQRMLYEINAWHILISLPPDQNPQDTLQAWKKAVDIRERIKNGERFENVARSSSDDQSVKVNGGNLGYFTAFQMIMPFEDAAYSSKKGEISDPVRTPYGYHVIMVTDKRPSKGKVHVAHIMKVVPQGATEEEYRKGEESINEIYRDLQSGAPFSELARTLSDHRESGSRGGELSWFGAGEMIPEFAEASLSLSDTGDYSKPVRSYYGWHIIKLLDKRPQGSFDESRSYIESKINQSYLNAESRKELVTRLKKEYRFRIDDGNLHWFVRNTDTLIIMGLKKYNRDSIPKGKLYTFANQSLTAKEFAGFAERRGQMIVTRDSSLFIENLIAERSSDHIITYENSILEKKYPEFRYLMNEFHDGILLFEISGKRVWNRINWDSTGLTEYYNEHKYEYLSKKGIEAKIYTLKEPGLEKKLDAAYSKYSKKPDCDALLLKKFNKKDRVNLSITDSTWYQGSDPEIDAMNWDSTSQNFVWNGFRSILTPVKIIEQEPLPLERVKGEMLTGFQEKLENDWVIQLKERYDVKVDSNELINVKKRIENE